MTASARVPEAEVAPEFVARWSPRAFRPDPLTSAQVASLFEAMRWAPSCFNEQPWRVVYGVAGEPEHARLTGILILSNQIWAARAPLLLILFARRHFTHNGKPNRNAAFDAGAAWMSLALQAGRLGLHAHAMAGFDTARAYTELGVDPEAYEALAAIAVGQRDDPDALPEPLRAREVPSPRSPQASFVFHGRFPAPAP
jgi:nitroreductase